jgi:hypothetical protein
MPTMPARYGVSVVVPRGGACEHRQRAWRWVSARLTAAHPSWEVVEGFAEGPWCKAAAVADGLSRASGDVLIVHDADVWTELEPAVGMLDAGAPWVIPHRLVHRLNETATAMVLAGAEPATPVGAYDEAPYVGWEGGGVVVLNRADYDRAFLDARFQNWGQEDASWAAALDTLVGPHVRLDADLWHLWHPAPSRLSRRVGSKEGEALARQYQRAAGNHDRMSALVAGGRA